MKIKFILIALLLMGLSMLTFTLCGSSSSGSNNDNSNTVIYNNTGDEEFKQAKPISRKLLNQTGSKFTYKLFDTLLTQDREEKNLFISPISLNIALSIAYNGAKAGTKEVMAKTLELEGIDINKLNQAYKELLTEIENTSEDIEISLANSLWSNEYIKFKNNYMDKMRKIYNARIESADFTNPDVVDIINEWISENTNDMIKDMLDNIDQNTALLIINAVYFNGKWTNEFIEDNTRDREFRLADGTKKDVPMMHKYDEPAHYYEVQDYKALRMTYGADGGAGMYILLPKGDNTVADVLTQFDKTNWTGWTNSLSSETIEETALPKFKIEYKKELKDTFIAMGMGEAFNENLANFKNMSDVDLYISKVIHQAVVDVSEKGTEASASTVIEIDSRSTSFSEKKKYSFVADRPFLFLIKDETTNTILFMGVLEDPS